MACLWSRVAYRCSSSIALEPSHASRLVASIVTGAGAAVTESVRPRVRAACSTSPCSTSPFATPAEVPQQWLDALGHPLPPRVDLGVYTTPIQPWALPGMGGDTKASGMRTKLSIKRDDLTGTLLSGNKVRKLEYIFAEILEQGCDTVVTCGGVQSNHCRATAVAARRLGLDCHLFLRSDEADPEKIEHSGNLLVDLLVGAQCHLVGRIPYLTGLLPRMQRLQRELAKDSGGERKAYLMPVGGSSVTGLWGYIAGFQELLEQGLAEDYDDLVLAVGSGGTACGLAIANKLAGSPVNVHAISVSDHKGYFHGHVNDTLEELGLLLKASDNVVGADANCREEWKSENILNVIDGYKGTGYGKSTREELAYIREIACTSGIALDHTYTGKAAVGLADMLGIAGPSNETPNTGMLKGKRVLFLHTGGLFGLFDGRMNNPDLFDGQLAQWPYDE